jgi:hypothetical protein
MKRVKPRDFIGLGVSLDSAPTAALREMVAELGVRNLSVRIPIWDLDRLDQYVHFIEGFRDCDVMVSVLQNRESVCNYDGWRRGLHRIFMALRGRVTHFQIGQAPNRTKWGCITFGEFAGLLEEAESLRAECPWVRFVGPAVIDFEPLVMLRALINPARYTLDVVSALLYVDRRGAPGNRQYGFFDLERKIRFLATLAELSPRVTERARRRIWITETNWPLQGTGEFAPTSQAECVSEDDYADYMRGYFQQAYATHLVERVYWWQLAATGYGLVDPRDNLRKRRGYDVLRRLLSGDIPLG